MFHTLRRHALGLLLTTLLLPAAVFGQSGQEQTGGQARAPESGPVRRLSIDDAVKLALDQNLSLQVQRLDPQIQDLGIAQVRSAWVPTVGTTLSNRSSTNPTTNFLSGAVDQLTTENFAVGVTANQLLPSGGNYSLQWNNTRGKSNSFLDSPNPSLSSSLSAIFTQPLMRNFRIDSTRQQLLISRKNREMTDVQLRQTVLTTIRNVKSAYWDLAYAVDNLKVQQQSLAIARESLKNNKSRVKIGTMAPIDIIQAEAEVARNEEAVIVAEAQITRAEDVLRALIFDPKTPDFWTTRFDLTDQPVFQAQAVDANAAVQNALAKRTDLQNMRKSLEADDINIRYFKNQVLPDLNVQAGYGVTGQGGTEIDFTQTFPPEVVSKTNTPYSSVLSKMFGNDFHNWSIAVQVGYPIGRSNAEAGLARARVAYSQAELQLRNQELQVATEVREAVRTLNTNRKRVDATRASRELAERKLEAEEKKFQAGMNTNFEVIQAQRDLAAARNAELQAILDYNRSLVDFETVQEAPVGAGGGIVLATPAR